MTVRGAAAVPRLLPSAVRADGRPGAASGQYRGAIFAGDNPYSCRVWVSLRTHSQAGPAIRDAVAVVPDVRRGFQFEVGQHWPCLPGAA